MSEKCAALVLVRTGHAYEHFDQGDYDTADCGLPIERVHVERHGYFECSCGFHAQSQRGINTHMNNNQPSKWRHVMGAADDWSYIAGLKHEAVRS